jgi:hypothetical protein
MRWAFFCEIFHQRSMPDIVLISKTTEHVRLNNQMIDLYNSRTDSLAFCIFKTSAGLTHFVLIPTSGLGFDQPINTL